MRVALVTGGGGFIGRHLVDRLGQEGYRVRLLLRAPLRSDDLLIKHETFIGDIRDKAAVKGAANGCDTIFHLAARVHQVHERQEDEQEHWSVNVDGTKNLLEEGVQAGSLRRFIFFSSVKAMGENTAGCMDESAPPAPLTAYGRTKLEAEKLVLEYARRSDFGGVCLRLPTVYGPGNKGNIPLMIQAISRGYFLPIGPLKNRRSMVHVSNVVQAAILAANTPLAAGKTYIVSDQSALSTQEIYEMIYRALGKTPPRWHFPLPALKLLGKVGEGIGKLLGRRFVMDKSTVEKLTGTAWYDSGLLSRELGYNPVASLESSLPEMVRDLHRRNQT